MKTIKACKTAAGAAALALLVVTGASAEFMDFSGRKKTLEQKPTAVFSGTLANAGGVSVPLMKSGEVLAEEQIPAVDLRAPSAPAQPVEELKAYEQSFECEMGAGSGGAGSKIAFKAAWKAGAGQVKGAKISIVGASGGMAGMSLISTAMPAKVGAAGALVFELVMDAGGESASAPGAVLAIAGTQVSASCPGQAR